MYWAIKRASERVLNFRNVCFRNVWKSLQLGTAQLGATQCVTQRESDMPLAAYPCPVDAEIEKCVCVFITTVPNTKLCAWGEEDSGGHVL
jgi:hypothetical protein